MRKLILAISLLVYSAVTCGVEVNLHYCMDRLASVELFGNSNDRCSLCGMDMHKDNNCCHDESKLVKLEQDQSKPQLQDFQFPVPVATLQVPSAFIVAPFTTEAGIPDYVTDQPPLLSSQYAYIEFGVFRI